METMIFRRMVIAAIAVAMFMPGCNRQEAMEKETSAADSPPAESRPPAVARLDGEFVTAGDLQWYLDSRSAGPGADTSDQLIKDRLHELVVGKVLAREARNRNLDQDAAVKYAIEQMLGRKLIEEQIVKPVMAREVSRDEIEQYYARHKERYVRPRQVRVADIFLAAPDKEEPELREKNRQEAWLVLAEARKSASQRFGFSRLIQERSDKHPLYERGDTGFFDEQGKPLGLDFALVEKAFALERTGEVYDQVIETPEGFHVIMLVGIRQAVMRDMESVAPQIEQEIRQAEIEEKQDQLVNSLLADSAVETFAEQLEQFNGYTGMKKSKGQNRTEKGSAGVINLQGLN
ncbi:MAG: peptidyl-prolyl cis-trans isomerase [Desulfobulbaceae bacterium]|nr:peptidyl-prolyl cis-trans isomerase [Desulfobulbaceae bacterium]